MLSILFIVVSMITLLCFQHVVQLVHCINDYIVVFQLGVGHVLPDQSVTLLFFSLVFGMFFLTNLILWVNGSSAAIPFTTLVALLALWFGISVPLTFVGAYFGFKKRVSKKIVLLLVST